MIKYFRKIRQQLLTQNRFSKYLLYAVGEILLVMVGILLALQVNNWNEERKEKVLEMEILEEISENLREDHKDHNQNVEYINRSINASKIVLYHLDNNLPYHDSLSTHFSWLAALPNFEPINSGYQNLLSNRVNIIKNDTLRRKISGIYNQYNWLRDYLKDRQNGNNQPLLIDMTKKFKVLRPLDTAVPLDYSSLKNDHEFNALIQQNLRIMDIIMELMEDIIKLNYELIENIKSELNSR